MLGAPFCVGTAPPGRSAHEGLLAPSALATQHPSPSSMGLDGRCYVPDNVHGFFIVPQRKLLLCAAEKVGLQMSADLMCSLGRRHARNDSPELEPSGTYSWEKGCNWQTAMACGEHHKMDAKSIGELLSNPDWVKAAFHREPLERFLSGYKSKCEDGYDPDRWICNEVFGAYNASFEQAVAVAATWDHRKGLPPGKAFDHFRLQSDMCMGTLTRPEVFYNTVGKLEPGSEETRAAVASWLRHAGIDAEDEPAFRRHFPKQSEVDANVRAHERNHSTNAEQTLSLYYKEPWQVAAIARLYLPDYQTFKLKLPPWAATMLEKQPGHNADLLALPGPSQPATDGGAAKVVGDPLPRGKNQKQPEQQAAQHENGSQTDGRSPRRHGPAGEPQLVQREGVTPEDHQVVGNCRELVRRASAMQVLRRSGVDACQNLTIATVPGGCGSYFVTVSDGWHRLCFDQSPHARLPHSAQSGNALSPGLDRADLPLSSTSEQLHRAEATAIAAAAAYMEQNPSAELPVWSKCSSGVAFKCSAEHRRVAEIELNELTP